MLALSVFKAEKLYSVTVDMAKNESFHVENQMYFILSKYVARQDTVKPWTFWIALNTLNL